MLLRVQRLALIFASAGMGAFFVSATIGFWFSYPRVQSLLAHSDKAAENTVTGTGVWANASNATAQNVQNIATDIRTTVVKFNRELIPSGKKALDSASGALDGVKGVAEHSQGTADAASNLLASAQRTTDQMPTTLTAFNGAIGNLSDLAGTGSDSLNQFNALLERKSLTDAIDGLGATAQNAGKISADLHVWSHPILNPDPCVTAGCRWKKGLAVAGSFAGFGSNLYGAKNLFSPLSVKVQK